MAQRDFSEHREQLYVKPTVEGEFFDGWEDKNKTHTQETSVVQLKTPEGVVKSPEKAVESRYTLPWAQYLFQQCKATRERRDGETGHFGRCELVRNHGGIDHALERGMDIPRWSTDWTG